jgi:hypothetical protein
VDNPATATSFAGFGINSGVLRYQVGTAGDDHIFYGAANEYARITNVGISVKTGADPTANLQVTGNAFVSNAVTTTNVFAITATVPGFTSQFTVNGGGTVTYSAAGNLLWSGDILVIPAWKNAAYATAGFWAISCPTSGTIPSYSSTIGTVTCTTNGIPMSGWFALYYRVVPGTSQATVQGNFILKDHNDTTYSADSNWILLAARNGTTNEIKWMPGNTTIPLGGTFYTPSASFDKVQVAGTVVVDSTRSASFLNVFSSNALATTNVFANTLTMSNATSTINVIGSVTATTFYGAVAGANTGAFSNLYSANSVTTTNLFTAGFTSNAANTVFNFDTLAIPFITSTTLNVSSTSNLSITNVTTLNDASILGTNLNVTGTSNLSTTNVTTLNAASILGTNLNVTGTSNLSTTNVTSLNAASISATSISISGSVNFSSLNLVSANIANIYTTNIVGFVGSQWTGPAGLDIYYLSNVGIGTSTPSANLQVVGTTNLETLNVTGYSNLATLDVASANIANIYTTNIVGFVGSQWSGAAGGSIYYLSNVGIGTSTASANLQVSGNLVVSNTITTSNLILSGNANVSGYSNLVTANIGLANIATANVLVANVTNPIPVTTGLFMNLMSTYTLNETGNWYGNIASTWSSNLYTLFAPDPVASWTTYGSNPLVTGPTANGGFKFSQTGAWAFTAVITADNNIKTLALSSNTSDVHSNLADTDVWEYVYRIGVGQDPSVPITIPFYVDDTNKYYFLDIEATNRTDNIHRTRYTNAAAETYTGSYVILKPI